MSSAKNGEYLYIMKCWQPITGTDLLRDNIVIKTHDKKIDEWVEKFGNKYDLYFIISDRGDYEWDKYYQYNNVLFISFEDLLENEKKTLKGLH